MQGAEIAGYNYDALGRRSSKTVFNGENYSTVYYVYDIMGRVITEYEQTGDAPQWSRDYIYGAGGELLALHLPRTAAMNTAFDNLLTFAEAWLCDPNCPQGLLVWDTVADGFIDYLDYADNLATFEGAFATNYRYIIADNDNSAIGVVSIDGSIEYIDYDAWG